MTRPWIPGLVPFALAILACQVSCTSDPGGGTVAGACQMLIDTCHTKDDGTDDAINGCHSKGHDGDEAACSDGLQACLDTCNDAPSVIEETEGSDGHGEHGEHGESSDGGSTSSTGSEEHGEHGEETTPGSSSSSGAGSTSTGAECTATCADLGSLCHDTPTELGVMCHDVGHDGDAAACAEICAACVEECS